MLVDRRNDSDSELLEVLLLKEEILQKHISLNYRQITAKLFGGSEQKIPQSKKKSNFKKCWLTG